MRTLLALAVVFPSLAFAQATFPVTIDPGAYAGRYAIRDASGSVVGGGPGPITLGLAPGSWLFDDGAAIGGSSFYFTVDAAGNVPCVPPYSRCGAAPGVLQLANVAITINAGNYPFNYCPYIALTTPISGTQTLSLIPQLTYYFDDCTFLSGPLGSSAFVYTVDASGNVACTTPAATCAGSSISLQSANVTIDPGLYSFDYSITSNGRFAYSGLQTLSLLAGLVEGLDDRAFAGASEMGFLVNPDGSVTSWQPASATSGSKLTFINNSIHIDSGGYPNPYQVNAAGPFTGAMDAQLVAGLVTVINAINEAPGTAIEITPNDGATPVGTNVTATTGGATPSSWTFNSRDGHAYTFQFSIAGAGGSATLTFSTVTAPGVTSLTTSGTGQPPPAGFKLGNPPHYYDVSTTASYSGAITVCIDYSGIAFGAQPRLFHLESGQWVDRTTSVDAATTTVCGSVTSLSPFAIFQPAARYHVCPLYDVSKAVQSGAVIPIKLALCDANGNDLSAANIMLKALSVIRGDNGQTEPLQSAGNANQGDVFRWDASLGGYLFNLKTTGYPAAPYTLSFAVSSDPAQPYSTSFRVR